MFSTRRSGRAFRVYLVRRTSGSTIDSPAPLG